MPSDVPTAILTCDYTEDHPCVVKPGFLPDSLFDPKPTAGQQGDAAQAADQAAALAAALPKPPTELWSCGGPVAAPCALKPAMPPAADADAALAAALVAGNTATLTPQRPIPVFEPVAAQPANLPPTTTIGGDQPGPSGSTSIVDSAKIQ